MPDCRYLLLRGHSWNFRLKVPADLKNKHGLKIHITEPLGTRDLKVAQDLRWELRAHWTKEFARLRGKPIEERANARGTYWTTREQAEEGLWGRDDDLIGVGIDVLVSEVERRTRRSIYDDRNDPETDSDVIDPETQAKIDGLNDFRKYQSGEEVTPAPVYAMTFSEAGKAYLEANRGVLVEQTRLQYETAARLFAEHVDDKPVSKVTARDAVAFFDIIRRFDPLWGRSPKTKERTFKELQRLYGSHETGLSVKTLNRYVTALSCIWEHAKKRQEARGDNPFKGQWSRVTRKNSRPYRPLTDEELAKLFKLVPKHRVLWEIPLVALYTGMRLNEICSLQWANVRQEDGIWYFDIIAAKSEAGVRVVPVHNRLAWLLERRSNDPAERVWPELTPGGPDGKYGWKVSKQFTVHRRAAGIEGDDRWRTAFHSLRKNVTRCFELARLPQTEAAEIIGHEKQGITYRVYNPDGLTMFQRKEIVEVIAYPGLEASGVVGTWQQERAA
ncbi:DUF6538 domain-containing protein [Fodinicurvata halophila]|uniref:DUF6538 domain-containing protein n=1 Tax=Fodinicurvata halophila TaxID=1419723 RepID=A0ABV8UKV4_9PROT